MWLCGRRSRREVLLRGFRVGLWIVAALLLCCRGQPGVAAEAVAILHPGDDIQRAIDAHPPGAVFRLLPGIFRGQSIVPKDGQQFIGEDGTILDGSIPLPAWRRDGQYWIADALPRPLPDDRPELGLAGLREDLFVDQKLYKRVANQAELGPGRWFSAERKAYLTDDPRGKLVEMSATARAIGGSATGVLLKNLVIRKYATSAQHGAIAGGATRNWTLVDVVALWNHGLGLAVGDGMRVEGGAYSFNGQLGIGDGAGGHGIRVEGVDVAHNNFAGFDHAWEAGGIKLFDMTDVVIRRSRIHDNQGPGIWFDTDNRAVLIDGNCVVGNDGDGIQYEISYDAVIRENLVGWNARNDKTSWLWGAGILLQNSAHVEVRGNIVIVERGNGIALIQQNRGSGAYGTHATIGNRVRGNIVLHLAPGGRNGAVADFGSIGFGPGGNIFDGNIYVVTTSKTPFWTVGGENFSPDMLPRLRSVGVERSGSVIIDPAPKGRLASLTATEAGPAVEVARQCPEAKSAIAPMR